MTQTNQQGAPEALYASAMEFAAEKASISYVQRKCRCSWNDAEQMLERMVREGIIATYGGRKSAALVEAQQPTTHVQNPAEIEHVAGDVSKNGPESNMAQQPAPSAAADPMDWPLPCDVTVGHGTMCKGVSLRTLVMRMKVLYEMATGNNADEVANRTPEENTALADAFRARIAAAPKHPPAPQADSQPAPVLDYPPLPARRRAFLCTKCGGRECEPGTIGETHPPCKCGYLGFAEDLDFTADDMRAYVDADRAARAPADSVTAPAGGARPGWKTVPVEPTEVMFTRFSQQIEEGVVYVGGFLQAYRCMLDAAPIPPAQAADSVLEDAARLERERICAAIKAEDDYCVDQGDYMLDSDDCIKIVRGEWVRPDFAIDAARKQGANHD